MARLTKYVLEEMGAKATYSSIATFVRLTWQRHTQKLGLGRRPPSPYPCPPTSIEVPSCRRKHVCIDTLQQTAKLRGLATNGLNRKSDGCLSPASSPSIL